MAQTIEIQSNSTTESIRQILEHGLQVADDSSKVHRAEDIRPGSGQFFAQGDINIIPLAKLPQKVVAGERVAQLAPGTSRGSRHCVSQDDMHKVTFYKFPNAKAIQGPVMEFTGDVTIEHPEHGNQTFPAGIYAITYQVDHAEELKRIQD